jgi:hypothetical protein
MFNWDKTVDSHFDKKASKKRELERLLENVFGQVKGQLLKEAADSTQDTEGRFKLPPIKLAETWGRLENGDRERLWRFAKNLSGTTLEAKIAEINKYLLEPAEGADVNKLLSVMMITEILSNILTDFTESASGFIFEAFLAGLFGGDSVQITDVGGVEDEEEDTEGEGRKGKPITDVVLGGKHYSLKLLKAKGMIDPKTGKKSSGTAVVGSWTNMISHLLTQPEVTYLDVRKEGRGQRLSFGEVTVNLANIHRIFVDPFVKPVAKGKSVNITDIDQFIDIVINQAKNDPLVSRSIIQISPNLPDETEEFISQYLGGTKSPLKEDLGRKPLEFTVSDFAEMAGEDPEVLRDKFSDVKFQTAMKYRPLGSSGPNLIRLFGKGEAAAENLRKFYQLALRYEKDQSEENRKALVAVLSEIPKMIAGKPQFGFTQAQFEGISNFKLIGTLNLEEGSLKELWLKNAQLLEQTIAPVYRAFDDFSQSIEKYFTSGNEDFGRKSYGDRAITSSGELNKATKEAVTKMEAGYAVDSRAKMK